MNNDSDPIMFFQRQNKIANKNRVAVFNSNGLIEKDGKMVVNVIPIRKPSAPSRNKPCPCGQGKKFKNCCRGAFEQQLQAYFEETSVLPEGFNEVLD